MLVLLVVVQHCEGIDQDIIEDCATILFTAMGVFTEPQDSLKALSASQSGELVFVS